MAQLWNTVRIQNRMSREKHIIESKSYEIRLMYVCITFRLPQIRAHTECGDLWWLNVIVRQGHPSKAVLSSLLAQLIHYPSSLLAQLVDFKA